MSADIREVYREAVAEAVAERDAAIAAGDGDGAIAKFDEWNAAARASRDAALSAALDEDE